MDGAGGEDGRLSLLPHAGPPAGRGLETGGGALVSFCALGALAESALAPAVSLYCVGDIESTRAVPGRTDRRSSQPRSSDGLRRWVPGKPASSSVSFGVDEPQCGREKAMLGLIISPIHRLLRAAEPTSRLGRRARAPSQPRHSVTPTGSLPAGTPWLIKPLPHACPCRPWLCRTVSAPDSKSSLVPQYYAMGAVDRPALLTLGAELLNRHS